MDYKIYAIDENRNAVPGAVASIYTGDGVLITTIPFGPGAVLTLSSELDGDLFLDNSYIRVTAPGYETSGTDMWSITNYDAYEFTIRRKPSVIKPVVMGVGITILSAWLYTVLKKGRVL